MVTKKEKLLEMALAMTRKGYIPVYGDFDSLMEEIVIACITEAQLRGQKELTLLINSDGGGNNAAAAIRSTMTKSGIHFTGYVVSRARSNGLLTLLHCHRRIASFEATLMFHWGYWRFDNGMLAELVEAALMPDDEKPKDSHLWPVRTVVSALITTAKRVADASNLTLEELVRMAVVERDLRAEEALDMGLIDEIDWLLKDETRQVVDAAEEFATASKEAKEEETVDE